MITRALTAISVKSYSDAPIHWNLLAVDNEKKEREAAIWLFILSKLLIKGNIMADMISAYNDV